MTFKHSLLIYDQVVRRIFGSKDEQTIEKSPSIIEGFVEFFRKHTLMLTHLFDFTKKPGKCKLILIRGAQE